MAKLALQADLWYNEATKLLTAAMLITSDGLRRTCLGGSSMDTLPPHADNGNIPEKRCTLCGEKFPATPEFFYRARQTKDGLFPHCKECRSKADKEYRLRPGVQTRRRVVRNAYRSQPEVQVREHAYVRVYNKDYYSRPDIQAHRQVTGKTYRSRPDVKVHKQAVREVYRSRPEGRDQERKYNSFRRARKNAVLGEPLSRVAGTDIPANDISYLVLACPACNLSKGDKFPWEFPEGGRLL